MDIKIYPGKLSGTVSVNSSKSQAHRLLICAAFSDKPTVLLCKDTSQDIEATVSCLNALGASISRTNTGYYVVPVKTVPTSAELDCNESGATLRFILPIVCALGIHAKLHMSGRLSDRPLSPLLEELTRMGCSIDRTAANIIQTSGKLSPGRYFIPGNVSSQFVTGLLFALSLLDGKSSIRIEGNLESKPYVDITKAAMSLFGVKVDGLSVTGSFPYTSPGIVNIEGDWSNAAFFLVAEALGSDITVHNLETNSLQGDRIITEILKHSDTMPTISAADIPDLIPVLSVFFAANHGVVFTDIARLRHKESDRVASIVEMLCSLGIYAVSDKNSLTVHHGKITGGVVNSHNDHRIAMAASIAATIATGPVTICDAHCVAKSYPAFWQDFSRLGGKYEQYLR